MLIYVCIYSINTFLAGGGCVMLLGIFLRFSTHCAP